MIIIKKEINEQQEDMASLKSICNEDSTLTSSPIMDYFKKLRSTHEATCLEIVFDNAQSAILPPPITHMDDNTHPIEPTQEDSNRLTPNLLPSPSASLQPSLTTKQVEIVVQNTPRTAHKLARWAGSSTTTTANTSKTIPTGGKAASGEEDRCCSSSSSSYCLSSCLLYDNQNTPPMTKMMENPPLKYDTIPEIVFPGRSPSPQSTNSSVDSNGANLTSIQHILDDAILILS